MFMYWKDNAWHGPIKLKKPMGHCDAKQFFKKQYGADKVMIAAPNWEKING